MNTQTQRSASGGAAPRRRRWLRPLLVVAVVAAGAVVTATVAWGSSDSSRYRTALAEVRDVAQVLAKVGTVEPVSQASVSFGSAGTVGSVEVAEGDDVKVGDVLATLDPESLQAAVRQAQAALDQAELTLQQALAGKNVSGSQGSGSGDGEGVVGASSTEAVLARLASGTSQESDDKKLRAAQQAVLDAQKRVDADMRAAAAALSSAESICAALGEDGTTEESTAETTGDTSGAAENSGPSSASSSSSTSSTSSSSTSTTSSSTSTSSTTTSTTPPPDGSGDDVDECYRALSDALAAQQKLATSQQALAEAATALDRLLAERVARSGDGNGAQPGGGDAGSPPGDGSNPPSASGDDGSSGAAGPSAKDLIAYQTAVDAAEADLAAAQHALENNVIVSPVAGKVTEVGIQPGDEVQANSEAAAIVVAGAENYEVTIQVPVTDLVDIEVGQAVEVTPDALDDALVGKVTGIGVVPASGSGSTVYDVTVSLDDDPTGLRNGSIAAVRITTSESSRSVAVPTSAVRVEDGQYTVLVVNGAEATEVPVQVGSVGSTWTAITDGLSEGDEVVLADLDQPLPGSATDSNGGSRGPILGPGFGDEFQFEGG